MGSFRRWCVVMAIALLACGCASNSGGDPRDPLESFNRAMFNFNDGLDNAVLKPVSEGYRAVLPDFVRGGVSNFFFNLEDAWIATNQLLQGKLEDAMSDGLRFAFNTGFGIFGILDVASEMGLEKHDEDIGQTLARWGMESGPYLVLPILGPSTLRDGAGRLLIDWRGDPVFGIRKVPTRNVSFAARVVSKRTELLDMSSVVERAALDKYSFTRDGYLQRRESQIYDGSPPRSGQRSEGPGGSLSMVKNGSYVTPALLFAAGDEYRDAVLTSQGALVVDGAEGDGIVSSIR